MKGMFIKFVGLFIWCSWHSCLAAWPLILFNYNLPPEERFHKRNIISLGSIPKKPLDLDSFLWPVVQELLQFEIGVSAFDALLQSIFILQAYLIVVFGDIPAVSLIMCMKGHNMIVPC
jgi:Transposase family tnp2